MKYEDISPAMRVFIGNREGLRKLKFAADDIFCVTGRSALNGQLCAFCVLKFGGKEFSMECGPIADNDEKKFREEYARVSKAVNARRVNQVDLDRIWQESMAHRNGLALIQKLIERGFPPPCVGMAATGLLS